MPDGDVRPRIGGGRLVLRLLALTLPLNFAWEMVQAPAFTGMPAGWVEATAVCAVATLGDGVIVLGLFGFGWLVFRDPRWLVPPRFGRYAIVVLAGIAVQVIMEWIMVYRLGRWGYAGGHLVVPFLGVGLLPIMQAIVLLPLIFWALARWAGRS